MIKCSACQDTGDTTGRCFYDCAAPGCTAAADRVALNEALAVMPLMTSEDLAWAAYQAGVAVSEKRHADECAREVEIRLGMEKKRADEYFEWRVSNLMRLIRANHKFDWPFTDAFDDGGIAYNEAKRRIAAGGEPPKTHAEEVAELAAMVRKMWGWAIELDHDTGYFDMDAGPGGSSKTDWQADVLAGAALAKKYGK